MNQATTGSSVLATREESQRPGTLLSVIVALGAHLAELPEGVRSALFAVSSRADAELIVVDDEAAPPIRSELAALAGPIRIRHNLIGSFGTRGSLAAGASIAEGRVLVFLAAEANLAPGALDLLCEAFAGDPGLGLVQQASGGEDDQSSPIIALRGLALTSIGGPAALYRPLLPGEEQSTGTRLELTPPDGLRSSGSEQRYLLHPGVVPALVQGRWRRSALPLLAAAPAVPIVHWGPPEPERRAIERPWWVPVAVAAQPRRGVNVIGLLEAACGVGDAARRYIEAIASSGLDYATYAYHGHNSPPFPYEQHGPRSLPYDLNLLALNAELLPYLAWSGGAELWRERYNVGLWFWELEELSASIRSGFRFVNELWVSSTFLERAFAAETDRGVFVVPLPVRRREGAPGRSRRELGMPEAFTFLTIFDFGSLAVRKNSLGVVRAFTKAFAPGEGPVLVLKTLNAEYDRAAMRTLEREIGGRRDIAILDGYLADEAVSEMTGSADCFVSLHRSEGFGLTPADAMAWGRPVIATGYSGNLEFMNEENSYLVSFDRAPVPADLAPVYPTGSHWAEPRLEHASALMRRVYEHQDEAALRGAKGQRDIRRSNSLEASARVIARRVEEISRLRGAPRTLARDPSGLDPGRRRRSVTTGRRR